MNANAIGPPKKGDRCSTVAPKLTQTCPNVYHKPFDRQAWLQLEFDQKTRLAENGRLKNGTCYEPLATVFTLGPFSYRQIAREGDIAIYEQRWNDSPNVCFELIRIQRREAETFPDGRK